MADEELRVKNNIDKDVAVSVKSSVTIDGAPIKTVYFET